MSSPVIAKPTLPGGLLPEEKKAAEAITELMSPPDKSLEKTQGDKGVEEALELPINISYVEAPYSHDEAVASCYELKPLKGDIVLAQNRATRRSFVGTVTAFNDLLRSMKND